MPRYPEAENPFGAQLERVKSIRHFLGRQAANNPGLCNSKESLPMCFPVTPPCQSRKVSSSSVMEKHAAEYSWEGGSKKVVIWTLWKILFFVKSIPCFGLGLQGISKPIIQEIWATPHGGLGMHCIKKQWLGQQSANSGFGSSWLPACFQTSHSTFLALLE